MSHENFGGLDTRGFIARLASLPPEAPVPNDVFADIVYTAITKHGLPPAGLRGFFGLSAFAIDHWTQGKNLPQQMVRAKICGWIAGELQKSIDIRKD